MTKVTLDIETIPSEHAMTISPRNVDEDDQKYFTRLSCSGVTGQIICIGYAIDDREVVTIVGEEEVIIQEFWSRMIPVNLFIGHNILDFDIKHIIQRSIIHRLPYRAIPFIRFRNFPIYDTMHEWTKWHGRVHLSELALAFGFPSPKEVMSGAEVWPAYQRGEIEKIRTYCAGDVETTRNVYKRMI